MKFCWDSTKILRLIHLYQENECLWNTQSIFYKKLTARDNAYNRILQGINDELATKQILKNTIKGLRNTYLQESTKVKEAKKLGHIYRPKLSWFDELSFLARYIEDAADPELSETFSPSTTIEIDLHESACSSMDSNDQTEICIKKEFEDNEENEVKEDFIEQEIETPEFWAFDEPPSKRKKFGNDNSVPRLHSQTMPDGLNSTITSDEFFYFGLSVAAQLRNTPIQNALQLQNKIQDLITSERHYIVQSTSMANNCSHTVDMELNGTNIFSHWKDPCGSSIYTNNQENEPKSKTIDPCGSIAEFNHPKNEIIRTLHTIIESQHRMQAQLLSIQSSCDRPRDPVLDKMMRQNLLISKETFSATRRHFGEIISKFEQKIETIFPIATISDFGELEKELQNKDNKHELIIFLINKRGNRSLDWVFRNIITDEIASAFNWDGRWGKKSLKHIKLFSEVLNDVFCNLNKKEYETELRRSIELSHNRSKQKRLKQSSLNKVMHNATNNE